MSQSLAAGPGVTRSAFFSALFAQCAGVIELRAFPSKARCFAGLGDGTRGGHFIAQRSAEEDVYLGVATRRDASGGALAHCRHLGALFADADFKTTPEAEIRARLAHALLPPSAIVHSGGGLHCYWFLREPLALPDDAARAKALLRRLAVYLGGDRLSAEPARILRVPGTWNHKPDYPTPRPVRLEQCDPARRYNPREFDDWLPAEPTETSRGGFAMPTQVPAGTRNDTLYREARSLFARGFGVEEVTATLTVTNQTKCRPPLPAAEVAGIIANAATQPHDLTWRGGTGNGAQVPAPQGPSVSDPSDQKAVDRDGVTPEAQSGAIVTQLSTIAPEAVTWLWPGRVARGKSTVLAGDPGLGKSFIALDVASRLTTGRAWPDGGAVEPGDVVLLSAEDGPADTIRPRVDALGGDPERVYLLRAIRDADGERPVSLDRDLAALEQTVARLRPVLVVIDPLTAYLGSTDSYRDADVRRLLAPLAHLAETYNVALLLVMHLTKNSQTRALYRPGGSIAFTAAARIQLFVGSDPEDATRRVLAPGKNNLAPPPAALAYRLIEDSPGGPPRLIWDSEPVAAGLDADALLAGAADDAAERQDADAVLRDLLADGERPSAELLAAARANGVPERTLYRAKRRLGVKARHAGQPGTRGAWYWYLPDPECAAPKAATPPSKAATHTAVAAFEEPSEKTNETARTSPKAATSPNMAAFGGSLRADGSLPAPAPAPGEERL
jgi:putative DNA primase/helicase